MVLLTAMIVAENKQVCCVVKEFGVPTVRKREEKKKKRKIHPRTQPRFLSTFQCNIAYGFCWMNVASIMHKSADPLQMGFNCFVLLSPPLASACKKVPCTEHSRVCKYDAQTRQVDLHVQANNQEPLTADQRKGETKL